MKKKTGKPPQSSASRRVAGDPPADTPSEGNVIHVPGNNESRFELNSPSTHLTMSQQAQNLLRFLNEDRAQQKFCDVSVCVGGNLYSAHKIVLAHGSSYFHAELSKNPGMTRVTLDHVDDSVFQHLLSFMYTSECLVAETDLAPLIQAARFLDMMDVLKLLCEVGGHTARQEEKGQSPEVEAASGDSPSVDTDARRTTDEQCPSENPLGVAEGQADVFQEALAIQENGGTTRRSTRSRRMPTKYQKMSSEHSIPEDYVSKPINGEDNKMEAAPAAQLELKEPSQAVPQEDLVDEVEDEGNLNMSVKRKKVCRVNKQGSGSVGRSRQSAVKNPDAATGSSTQSPVYPEGLAPIIIVSSRKKILQCPKCEKVFDRAGEDLTNCVISCRALKFLLILVVFF